MKRFFTLIAAVLLAFAAQAQTVVGNEDNTTPWWSAFSDYYTIPANQTLTVKFVNYTNGAANWNNWLAVVTNNVERGGDGYSEYFVLRADNYGWGYGGNTAENPGWFTLASNYNWDTFTSDMNGSNVVMTIARSGAKVTLHADITTAAGTSYFEEFSTDCGDGTGDIKAFLTVEGGHLVINSASVSGGQQATAESYQAILVDGEGNISLAPEFAAVVDADGNATNVADGKSVVTIKTANVVLEAVGGTTPANVDGGAQDITPGTALPDYVDQSGNAHPYAAQIASVGSWNNVTWKNGNNKLDINDVDGTKLYFVMGSGNPYITMLCEEIVTDDYHSGTYRALYEYYRPGMEMPQVGLYYKFTPSVNGVMTVQVWANKGNRNTYLINGQTKEAVPYKAQGYINGQRGNDETRPLYEEDGTPKLDNDGNQVYEQYQIFFTPEQIQQIHDDAKVVDGVDTAPYVIAAGNQAFWGWITFEAQAGVDYWLFQDSSQVGFGGFSFTPGDPTGIQTVSAPAARQDNGLVYNLQGQVVGQDYKGIVIKNGRKYIQK